MPKILIIDDSLWWRNRIKELLEKLGHETLSVGTVDNACKALSVYSPDCMIIDLIMSEGDGYQMLENLKEQENPVPVIVLTADFQEETKKRCMALGAFDVIVKEKVKNELAAAVSTALESA